MKKVWPFIGLAIAVACGVAAAPFVVIIVSTTWRFVLTLAGLSVLGAVVRWACRPAWAWLMACGVDPAQPGAAQD